MGSVRLHATSGRSTLRRGIGGNLAFASLSIGLLASLAACSSRPIQETPLENQTDEVADLSAAGNDGTIAITPEATDEAAAQAAAEAEITEMESQRPVRTVRRDFGGPRRVAYRGSKAPQVAAAPFQAGNFWMNGFYFVRGENETWGSISAKLYDREDRKDLLKSWNGGKRLEVGSVVYYNSPFRPEDSSAMKVFAEDFGSPLESVTVQSGDWLSTIGQARYGNMRTWLEIAALNPEIRNPDQIEVGQTLRLQPAQVNSQAALQRMIQEVAKAQENVSPLPDPQAEAAVEEATPPSTETAAAPEDPPSFEESVAQVDTNPEQVEEAPPAQKERPTKTAQGPPLSEDMMLYGAAALATVLLGLILMRRIRARREQQAALEQAAQVTNLRSRTGSDA